MIITLFFFIFISNSLSENIHFKDRCLWVVRYSLDSKSSIDKMLGFAVQHNFNHIFVQVRGRGDSLYRSSWIPRSEVLSDDYFDPLEYVIKEGHRLKLNIHAWVNVYMLWSAENHPDNEHHLFNRHPDWLDAVEEESQKYLYTHKRSHTDASGKEGFYLAPHHPGVNPYLLAVFKELLNHYELDGLHLDYVRFKNESHGYNPIGIEQFRNYFDSENGVNAGDNKTRTNKNSYNEYLIQREEFLCQSVTELVLKLRSFINNSNKEMIFSAAVKPNIEKAKQLYFQEWDIWLSSGLMDWVLVMNYDPSFQTFMNNISTFEDRLTQSNFSNIIMGVALYNQSPDVAKKKLKYSYNAGFTGIALFSYDVMKEQINKMKPVLSLFSENE